MRAFALSLLLLVASCGFQLRGSFDLPVETLHVSGADEDFIHELKRSLSANTGVRITDTAKEAQASLLIPYAIREKHILSVSGAGKVREFELRLRVSYSARDAKGTVLIPTTELKLRRELTYDDTQVLAKESEEAVIYRDMQNDAIGQILRRLTSAKKQ